MLRPRVIALSWNHSWIALVTWSLTTSQWSLEKAPGKPSRLGALRGCISHTHFWISSPERILRITLLFESDQTLCPSSEVLLGVQIPRGVKFFKLFLKIVMDLQRIFYPCLSITNGTNEISSSSNCDTHMEETRIPISFSEPKFPRFLRINEFQSLSLSSKLIFHHSKSSSSGFAIKGIPFQFIY